jgi:hypothetical protein
MAGMEEADAADAKTEGAESESEPEASARSTDGDDNGYNDAEDPDAIEPIFDNLGGDWGMDDADDGSFAEEGSADEMEVDNTEDQGFGGHDGDKVSGGEENGDPDGMDLDEDSGDEGDWKGN